MARYNKIFAGPAAEVLPQVAELPAASGGIMPGSLIVYSDGSFALAGADTDGKVYVAQDNYLVMRGVDDAYDEGDVVIGMNMPPHQMFNMLLATGNDVSMGDALTPAAGGAVALAGADDFVVATAEESYNNDSGSAQLIRARAVSGYYAPSAT